MTKTIQRNYGTKTKIVVKTNLEINLELEDKIFSAICNAFWFEDDIKGLVAMDCPISKDSTYWLENIVANVVYNEKDIPCEININCKMFDNGKLPDMETINYGKAIAKAIWG